jgi:MHS family alpha-ketoglutarate permease-like MFS transporter
MNYGDGMETTLPADVLDRPVRLTRAQKTAIAAATLGTIVEFADWVIYATFASLFSRHFFPADNEIVSLLSAFAVFAVGFIMRPVGGAVLGAYADRHGRKKGLTLSVALMASSTILVAICPVYATIGMAAPVILVLARLVQGFAAGGEFGSASTYLVESAAPSRRAFAGSWQYFGINAGVLVAAIIGYILTSALDAQQMSTVGWRLGFAIAGLLGLVALWIRRSVAETDAFRHNVAHRAVASPSLLIVTKHWRASLRVVGIAMAGNLTLYLWLVLFPTFAHVRTGLSLQNALSASVISIILSLVAIPLIGKLADRVGRKPVLLTFAGGSALFAWPGLHFLSNDFWLATAIVSVGMLLSCGYAATAAAVMAEQFPSEVRNRGGTTLRPFGDVVRRHVAVRHDVDVKRRLGRL